MTGSTADEAPTDRLPRPRLSSTYRVQLNKEFTIDQARAIVPYLEQLGVSHLYTSPVSKARPGSMHGYDVVDPTVVNPELGTDEDFRGLAADLHERGMGLIVDIVPNHMGVGSDNRYWQDVLTHGERSRYARWFDIDWSAGGSRSGGYGRVVLPVLGAEIDDVIARGDIRLEVTESGASVRYFDKSFPVNPTTLPPEVRSAPSGAGATGWAAALSAGEKGRRPLRRLLDAQHYRLTFWRRGPNEINYRRFFDVNDLVALHMEDPEVFAETHGLILRWVAEGIVDGLRVDHVDGLLDPAAYLARLRDEVTARRPSPPGAPFPIVVEKILSPGERMRAEWPVQGTTGYDFLNDLEDLFVEPTGYAAIEASYRRLRRLGGTNFGDVAHAGKVKMLTGPLRADVRRLARLLRPVAVAADGGSFADRALASGIVQFIAALPVYRTYVDGSADPPHPDDAAVVGRALAAARERNAPDLEVVELIGAVLLDGSRRGGPDGNDRLRFVQRLQQLSGPATAKGVEDTALYRYVPLASRNEVGGAPDRALDDAPGRLHRANAERQLRWPGALVCTNTHDTKRSADVRARLDVLSEIPEEWTRRCESWRRLNGRHRTIVKGRAAPDSNTEYLLYQTLLGIWPTSRGELPPTTWMAAGRERLQKYMRKAMREGKAETNWTEPNTDVETAVERFIAALFEPRSADPFLTEVAQFARRVATGGFWGALARVLLRLTVPGVPDTYQGDELWNLALVDPDNRRSVDYGARQSLLDALGVDLALDRLAAAPGDPRLKLLVTARVLRARRTHPDLFNCGSYRPLALSGEGAEGFFAFSRAAGPGQAIVIAPRLARAIGLDGRPSQLSARGITLGLPRGWGGNWSTVLDEGQVELPNPEEEPLPLAVALGMLPLGLLVRVVTRPTS